MSLIRRRMMMAKEPDVLDTPTEELDYLTIIPLHEEEVEYKIYPYGGSNDFSGQIYNQDMPFHYRLNNGDWIEVNLPESDDLAFRIMLNKDTELQLKCMGCNFSGIYAIDIQYFRIEGGGCYNVSGTPMSLLYGEGFKENNYVLDDSLVGLFMGEENLNQILNPKTFLPYTELGVYCYQSMFSGCKNLTNAPELHAKILASGCYNGMFRFCSKLNCIKMLGEKAVDWGGSIISIEESLFDWVYGVSSTGTFVKNKDATWDTTPGALGDSGVPAGWTVVNDGEECVGETLPFFRVQDYNGDRTLTYNFEIGMTFGDFVESKYNVDNWVVNGGLTPGVNNIYHQYDDFISNVDGLVTDLDYIVQDGTYYWD